MNTAAFPSRLWTAEETAEYLGVPLKTLYNWRTTARGPEAMVIGRHLRFDPQVVRDWANAQSDSRRSATA